MDRNEMREGVGAIPTITKGDTLSSQAYEIVRRAIRDGLILSNHIYSEAQIAKTLGVSRTPVREAVIALARDGVVDKLPQRGVRLRSVDPAEQQEVYDLRVLIEGKVVAELARKARTEDVALLREIIDRQAVASNPGEVLDIDEQFHLSMARLAGLERSRQILVSLRSLAWLYGSAAYFSPEWHERIVAQHRGIIDCIERGDPDAARRTIEGHIIPVPEPGAATRVPDLPQ